VRVNRESKTQTSQTEHDTDEQQFVAVNAQKTTPKQIGQFEPGLAAGFSDRVGASAQVAASRVKRGGEEFGNFGVRGTQEWRLQLRIKGTPGTRQDDYVVISLFGKARPAQANLGAEKRMARSFPNTLPLQRLRGLLSLAASDE